MEEKPAPKNAHPSSLIVPIWLIIKKGEERRFSSTYPPSKNWREALIEKGYQIFRIYVNMPPDWDDNTLTMNYSKSVEETASPSDDELRQVLAGSKLWNHLTEQLPVMAIAKAGPVNIKEWDAVQRCEVYSWAKFDNYAKPPPSVLQDYLAKVNELAEGEGSPPIGPGV